MIGGEARRWSLWRISLVRTLHREVPLKQNIGWPSRTDSDRFPVVFDTECVAKISIQPDGNNSEDKSRFTVGLVISRSRCTRGYRSIIIHHGPRQRQRPNSSTRDCCPHRKVHEKSPCTASSPLLHSVIRALPYRSSPDTQALVLFMWNAIGPPECVVLLDGKQPQQRVRCRSQSLQD